MRNERPGDTQDAGISGERPFDELGQLSVVTRRQIRAYFLELRLDEVIIVDEPFSCRRDRGTCFCGLGDGYVGIKQRQAIVSDSGCQRRSWRDQVVDRLRVRQTPGMCLQPLNSEQFLANNFVAVPKRACRLSQSPMCREIEQNGLPRLAPLLLRQKSRNAQLGYWFHIVANNAW